MSDIEIPADVLQDAMSNIPLVTPSGAEEEKWVEQVIFQGSKRVDAKEGGRFAIEVAFKVAPTGSPRNANKDFTHALWMSREALASRAALAADQGSKISLRTLQELARALGVKVDGSLIGAFEQFDPAMLTGGVIAARVQVKNDRNGQARFNMNGFSKAK